MTVHVRASSNGWEVSHTVYRSSRTEPYAVEEAGLAERLFVYDFSSDKAAVWSQVVEFIAACFGMATPEPRRGDAP